MELLLDDYEYSLQFSLTSYSTVESKRKWRVLKEKCENGNNEDITQNWLSCCNLELNKSLLFINSLEGGIKSSENKACRYRYSFSNEYNDNKIVLRYFTNSLTDKWNYDVIDDLIYAFEKMANKHVGGVYVLGSIGMIKKIQLQNSDDSDSD